MSSKKYVTHQKFTEDKNFNICCRKANVKPTKRQASKFRMKKGAAYNASKKQDN